jgi:ABC-2 type transport system permease protein
MLPPLWRNVALFNPIVYLVDSFRWAFYGIAAVGPAISLALILTMLVTCIVVVVTIFKTGYRLRT